MSNFFGCDCMLAKFLCKGWGLCGAGMYTNLIINCVLLGDGRGGGVPDPIF
jgi:hypothetical protein